MSGACCAAGCECGGGCCAVTSQQTPEAITNPPALSAVSYRAGRYATFLASMLAGLSASADPALAPLAGLRTRDPGDFSIALLDSWAVVLDILTFYSERLANEAYLRTALDQRSVTDLAALVGYLPSPGVAASATLALTLATAPGSPASALIPAGSRVQSVPGPGQTAQVYETSADLTALAAWNALPARTTAPWSLNGNEQSTWITGTASNISAGDALLFAAAPDGVAPANAPDGTPPTPGPAEVHYVTAVQVDPVAKATQLTWEAPLSTPAFGSGAAIYAFRKKAALYGANAPNPQTLATSGTGISSVTGWPGSPPGPTWDYQYAGNSQVTLDTVYPGLAPAAGGPPQWLALTHQLWPGFTRLSIFTVNAAADANPSLYTLTSRATTLTVSNPQTIEDGTAIPPSQALDIDDLLTTFIDSTPEVTAYVQSVPLTGAPRPLTDWSGLALLYPGTWRPAGSALRGTAARATAAASPRAVTPAAVTSRAAVPGRSVFEGAGSESRVSWVFARQVPQPGAPGMLAPVAGSAVTIVGGQQLTSGPAGLSGKRLRLRVAPASSASFVPAGASGGSVAADGQAFLVDAFPPVLDAAGDAAWPVITVSGVPGTLTIPAASPLPAFLPAATADPLAGEAIAVSGATPSGDVTTLSLAAPLARIYDAGTVAVNANAVLATNGQTVQEILGSGNSANPALTFTLKQAPLTYLTAPVASGAQSTLQVWVNNLRWRETPNLLTAGPADRVYTTSVNAAGNTVVQFGDGTQGGRPPTGQANIRAVYRTGSGLAGMVSAGQLSQPLDRPQGLSTVTNPGPSSPAADPATAGETRASAPLPTLTIGRVVSLEDYQDYALSTAGIAKALATWTWTGSLRGVFLTVAGTNGAVLSQADPIVSSLQVALRQAGDPNVPLTIASCQPALFTFTAAIAVDTTSYAQPAVLAQAWQAVSAAFAFGQRSLGQGVAGSEIIAVIQAVPGVIAVRLTRLGLSGQPAVPGSVLLASGPQPPSGAQLLVLDPASQWQIGTWS